MLKTLYRYYIYIYICIYPNPLQSNPWYKKISIWIFSGSKTISRIAFYIIEREFCQVFNWRNLDSWNNLKAWEKSSWKFIRPRVTLQGIRVYVTWSLPFFDNIYIENWSFWLKILFTRKSTTTKKNLFLFLHLSIRMW